jgi:tRNA(Ile2) C34 agmatinyltransferase TiaS
VAVGSAGRKIAWYIGTASLVFSVDVLTGSVFMALRTLEKDTSMEPIANLIAMVIVDVAMVAIAANTGKKCPACQTRIHPKATRCPKCQTAIIIGGIAT